MTAATEINRLKALMRLWAIRAGLEIEGEGLLIEGSADEINEDVPEGII